MLQEQPWNNRDATITIREISKSDDFDLWVTDHALQRMHERGLIMGDLLYVLRNGSNHLDCVPSTQAELYKYIMQTETPNSEGREVGVVCIPDQLKVGVKIVTVMWIDERATVAGSIIGEKS